MKPLGIVNHFISLAALYLLLSTFKIIVHRLFIISRYQLRFFKNLQSLAKLPIFCDNSASSPAGVAELVDAVDSKSIVARRVGSSPTLGTTSIYQS